VSLFFFLPANSVSLYFWITFLDLEGLNSFLVRATPDDPFLPPPPAEGSLFSLLDERPPGDALFLLE